MDGVTIPANLVVDVYSYRGRTYTFITQFDTTDGKSVTVNTADMASGNAGTDTPSTGNPANPSKPGTGNTNAGKPSVSKPAMYTHSFNRKNKSVAATRP